MLAYIPFLHLEVSTPTTLHYLRRGLDDLRQGENCAPLICARKASIHPVRSYNDIGMCIHAELHVFPSHVT